jgi:hypothetical protein
MLSQNSPKRWFRKKLQMQGAQKLRSEAHLQVRRNDEVEAQHRRWTFYETIRNCLTFPRKGDIRRSDKPGETFGVARASGKETAHYFEKTNGGRK